MIPYVFDFFSKRLLLWLLPLLVASYYPLIQLGTIAGVHIDISLLYVVMGLVVAANARTIWQHRHILFASREWCVLLFFVTYLWVSVLWSANPTRGLFTAGFFSILLLLCSTLVVNQEFLKNNWQFIRRLLTGSFTILLLFCVWQVLGDAFGAPSALTLLPSMYSGDVFGVARPTGLALEPQFLGSLLLVPLLYLIHLSYTRRFNIRVAFALVILATILFLTLSRGAIIATVLGALLIIFFHPVVLKRLFIISSLGFGALLLAVVSIGSIASVRDDRISGYDAITSTTNQLTFGVVSLPQDSDEASTILTLPEENTPRVAGYIESSTDSRLSMSRQALVLWHESLPRIFFGVGIGGFGATLAEQSSIFSEGSVVNNFYLELLAETGLVGLVVFILFFVLLVRRLIATQQYLLVAILAGLLLQWCFFSGTANVVHLWVLFGLAMWTYKKRRQA